MTDADKDAHDRPANAPALTLAAGDLSATVVPSLGMLGISLQFHGVEFLRRIDDLEAAARRGGTAGLPLLHPWANRLSADRYAAAGREVVLDPTSPLLHFDGNGLPMHGVPWSHLVWRVLDQTAERLVAELNWSTPDLLAVFPFRHRLTMMLSVAPGALTVETELIAGDETPVPVSFGFHPYFGIPNLPRAQWRLELPAMRHLKLDKNGIPTGDETPFAGLDTALGRRGFDDGFALMGESAKFGISGGGHRVTLEMLRGFRYAQVFAPSGQDYLAIEPMTAPANALISGNGLRLVAAGSSFSTAFRVCVNALSST